MRRNPKRVFQLFIEQIHVDCYVEVYAMLSATLTIRRGIGFGRAASELNVIGG